MVRIAVCDDDFLAHEVIEGFVSSLATKHGKIYCVYFKDGEEICRFYEKGRLENYFDIIFMDIEMKTTNGIEAAEFLRRFDKRALIVFTTNYEQFLYAATYTHLFRFLTKPLKQEGFFKAFEDACKTLRLRGKVFTYTNYYERGKILADNIVYFERHNRQVKICTRQGKSEPLWLKLGEVYEELKDYGFVRPHQSCLVNLKYISKIFKDELLLSDGKTTLPVSRREARQVRGAYLEYEMKRVGL